MSREINPRAWDSEAKVMRNYDEIKDYLDKKGIDYTGARLKGQLLELIPSKSEG